MFQFKTESILQKTLIVAAGGTAKKFKQRVFSIETSADYVSTMDDHFNPSKRHPAILFPEVLLSRHQV